MPLQPSATTFSTLLSRIDARDGVAVLDVPDDWLQGRTLFGGLQAVIGLAAMRSLVAEPPLRSLQVTFLGPVPHARRSYEAERARRTWNRASWIKARRSP